MSTMFTHIYNDGYTLGAMDCAHTPTAVAAGTFEKKNYYYYAFLYAISMRWEISSCMDDLLGVLGLGIEYNERKSIRSAIDKMSEYVAKDNPVLLFVPYNKLFYTVDYNSVNAANHGLLFIGYEDLRDSFMLMDSVQMWGANQEFDGKAETFIRFPMSRKVFTCLLEDMKAGYEKEDGSHYIPFYRIFRNGHAVVHSYSELMGIFLNINVKSRFTTICENMEHYREISRQNKDYPSRLRQQLNGTSEIIKDIVFRFLGEKQHSKETEEHIREVLDSYCGVSDRCTLWLLKNLLSEREPQSERIQSRVLEMQENERLLVSVIKEIDILPNKNEMIGLINLISNCSAKADSGFPLVIHPKKEDATIIWDSATEPTDHYMDIDLSDIYEVKRIEIKHSGLSGLTTSDFQILSSSDGTEFSVIAEKKDNTDAETIFTFDHLKCRYIRMLISKTSNYEFNTKIRGFQIFGI